MESEETTHEQGSHESGQGHKKNKRRILWFGLGLTALIVLALAIFTAWLYTGPLNESKAAIFKQLPLPASIVETKFVPAREIFNRYVIAEELLGKQEADARRTELYQKIHEQLIADAQADIKAKALGISISEADVNDQYNRLVEQLAGGNLEEFETAIRENYKLEPENFRNEVIRPELMQSKMQAWYNDQRELNTETFKKTEEILNKLKNNELFGELAKTYSDDEGTKNLEGDAGTLAITDMLPEFQEKLKDAKVGDIVQVSSRYGQHIIKIVERDDSGGEGQLKMRLQQIYVKQDGFAAWYGEQIKRIKVLNLLKF